MIAPVPIRQAERAVVAHYAHAGEVRASCRHAGHVDRCRVIPQLEDRSLDGQQAWSVRVYRQHGRIRIEHVLAHRAEIQAEPEEEEWTDANTEPETVEEEQTWAMAASEAERVEAEEAAGAE